jgi:beta-galactosidase
MSTRSVFTSFVLLAAVTTPSLSLWATSRTTISLNGMWQIEDSKDAQPIPISWNHKVAVPGLAHSAEPAFPQVDQFDSRMLIQNRVSQGKLPKTAIVYNAGVSRQDRNWFWYRRTFELSGTKSVAILRINKAQFGAAVWFNGVRMGDHLPCFTAAVLDVSKAIRPGTNELIVRVGAHPGVLPAAVSGGTDFEKIRWTPGIYDNVSLALSENPVIETVQIAPKIADSSIEVQTALHNFGNHPVSFRLAQQVHRWKQSVIVTSAAQGIVLAPGESKMVLQSLLIPGALLWSPESPNLYALETSTNGDTVSTRFGMREFRFDTATKRAYLNGRVYFMRGSNITLHRFFEDPLSGTLPWDEAWIRKLLVEIPHEMHWNSFRFCIGPVPDQWLEIADEAGLLIQNEYFVWTGHDWHGPENQVHFDTDEMIREYTEWMRDNWNHPSVVIWDANNETWDPAFGEKIIPAVRGLDLSNRPWENSYNPPEGRDDPVEDHPYEHQVMADGGPPFSMTTLESSSSKAPGAPSAHALILNEYGWLWLNRDGSPTELTKNLYPPLLGSNSTPEQRLALNAYLLAGLTEYWRAYRQYAGVLHFVYLTASDPAGYTSDHFRDVRKLELHSEFRDYLSNAFAPVGVYLSFWQPSVEPASLQSLQVMLVNDEDRQVEGTLTLALENSNSERVASQTMKFRIAALGQSTLYSEFKFPVTAGDFLLRAIIEYGKGVSTQSRRYVKVAATTH